MTLEIYMTALAPEIALVVAGCICLFLGLSGASFWRGAVAPFAFLAVAGVLILTRYLPEHGLTEGGAGVISGLSVGLLSLYVRWITLCVGMVLVLVNWYQADASERGEYLLGLVLADDRPYAELDCGGDRNADRELVGCDLEDEVVLLLAANIDLLLLDDRRRPVMRVDNLVAHGEGDRWLLGGRLWFLHLGLGRGGF